MKIKNLKKCLSICTIVIVFAAVPINVSRAEWGDLPMDASIEKMEAEGVKAVVFSHNIHRIRYKCKTCHPGLYKMMEGHEITMKDIKEGQSCGKCHNGTIAFSAEECDRCHNYKGGILKKIMTISDKAADKKLYMELERDKWGLVVWGKAIKEGKINPSADIGDEKIEDVVKGVDLTFTVDSDWVANVFFSHKDHTYWLSCENCHNDDIFSKDYNEKIDIRMREMSQGKWCGRCHNKIAFRFANCRVCHSLQKKKSMEKVAKEKDRSKKKKVRSKRMEEAKKRNLLNAEKQRKAREKWYNTYKEHAELKNIAPKPESMQRPDTPEEMVYIPGGSFLRGQDWGDSEDNQPSKVIELSPYFIDRLEVTVGEYKAYAKLAKKRTPYHLRDKDLGGDKQPLFKVKWPEAVDYCNYYKKRLPTEAEWEKAARGWDDRNFPWGNELPNADDKYRANYDPGRRFEDGYRYTSDVGIFKEGASPYGALDMSGNLWEWTADWYAPDYYKGSDVKDPQGPDSGKKKIVRGGGYITKVAGLLLTEKMAEKITSRRNYIGFRCAKSAD